MQPASFTTQKTPRLKTVIFSDYVTTAPAVNFHSATATTPTLAPATYAPSVSTRFSNAPQIYLRDPPSYNEAMYRAGISEGIAAIHEELKAHIFHCTWKTPLLPAGRKAITCKWTFKFELGPGPLYERKKVRLIMKNFQQKVGNNYNKTFSPTVRLMNII